MGFHATIGTSQTPAPRVKAFDRHMTVSGNPMQIGYDVRTRINGVSDKHGTPAWTTPVTAPWDIATPGFGAQFVSHMARSIVVRGDWRKPARGLWTIQSQMGMVKVTGGKVFLNGEYLGQVDMKTLSSKEGKNRVLTQIIAGTLTR
jgi:hypothetical protein